MKQNTAQRTHAIKKFDKEIIRMSDSIRRINEQFENKNRDIGEVRSQIQILDEKIEAITGKLHTKSDLEYVQHLDERLREIEQELGDESEDYTEEDSILPLEQAVSPRGNVHFHESVSPTLKEMSAKDVNSCSDPLAIKKSISGEKSQNPKISQNSKNTFYSKKDVSLINVQNHDFNPTYDPDTASPFIKLNQTSTPQNPLSPQNSKIPKNSKISSMTATYDPRPSPSVGDGGTNKFFSSKNSRRKNPSKSSKLSKFNKTAQKLSRAFALIEENSLSIEEISTDFEEIRREIENLKVGIKEKVNFER